MSANLGEIKLSKQDQIIALICLVFIGACVFFYNSLYQPKTVEIAQAQSELDTEKAEYERMKITAEQFDQLDRQVKETQLSLAEFEKKVPTEEDVPSLLVQLQETALQNGLEIKNINKNKEEQVVNTATPASASANTPQTGNADITYSKFSVNLSVESSFVSFASFMGAIENWERFVNVKNVKLSSGGKDDLKVDFTMEAFVQRKGGGTR